MTTEVKPKIVCIIQARMGSSRLPGKVLKKICGKPMLAWVVERASRSKLVEKVIIATTVSRDDDALEAYCNLSKLFIFRGSEFDVLDRYYQAAKSTAADIVVRLTADCPLIDPALIDETIKVLMENNLDFAANRLPPPYHRTYPVGLDVEVAAFPALETAWKNADEGFEREHVMPYIYDPKNGFKFMMIDHDTDLGDYRWTVDTPEDLEFVRQVTKELNCRNDFTWLDVLKLVNENPEIAEINTGITHKSMRDVDSRANLD